MTKEPQQDTKERHEAIAHYARQYALNRTVPFLFQTVVFLLLAAVIGGVSLAGGYAGMKGHYLLLVGLLVLLAASMVFCIWASVPRWGGRRVWQWGLSLYGSEGQAAVKDMSQIKWPKWGYVLMPLLLAGVFGHYALAKAGYVPVLYTQPISILYVAPFWLLMYWVQREAVGKWMLSAPIMSILYALLILAGLPLASDRFSMFWVNLYVPMFGFQTLSMILGHVYSRYALAKVKQLAHVDPQENGRG